MMQIPIIPDRLGEYYAYYLRTVPDNEIVYWGTNQLAAIFHLSELKPLPSFDCEQMYMIDIIGVFKTKELAHNACIKGLRGQIPRFNIELSRTAHAMFFRCNETGEVFKSQAQASKALGLNQGNLSRHLKQHPSVKTVKNYTFSYLTQEEVQKHLEKLHDPTQYTK